MGVDYIARKSAKKRKKKERQAVGKDGVAQRERRRKKIRRLCQGVCYKTPELTEEDKQWADDEENGLGADSDVEEAAARANSHRGASTSGADEPQQPQVQLGSKKEQEKKRKRVETGRAAADADVVPQGQEGKPGGLSTSVQLLDPAVLAENARQAALRKLPVGAKTDALEQFPALLQACMLMQHHVEPTPVQDRCWPPALAGRDVQGVAEPGSGKTLAYLLPGLVRLQADGHSNATSPEGPILLVLVPTRELAQQVAGQCRATRAVTGLRTVCVFGGAPREEQAALLAGKHPHVLVATPGRVLDLVDGGELKLQGHVRYLVLDEADKMLSLGFKPQLDRLYGMLLKPSDEAEAAAAAAAAAAPADGAKTGKKKKGKGPPPPQQADGGAKDTAAPCGSPRPQVMLFSATMPSDVAVAAAIWLRQPEVVTVGSSGANAISRTITQVVHVCAEHKKPDKLLKHLGRIRDAIPAGCRNVPRVLVFANRVKAVRFLATALSKEGYKVAQLHGQRSQTERNQAVSDFRSGKAQVLVATDVAARGLDIRSLPYVVNYDFPTRLETYVHRVGRTGRLAAYGHSYSFFTRNLAPLAPPLLELLQTHGQSVDPNLAALAAAWSVAEQKLGSKGAAAAAAAARMGEGGVAATDDGDDDDGDDDEGDASAAAREGDGLSFADEVLGAADDLLEGLGHRDALAIATLMKRKLSKQHERQQAGAATEADGDGGGAGGKDGARQPAGEKARREAVAAAAADAGAGEATRKGRAGDAQMVPTTKEQRRAMQEQQQPAGGRPAAFVASKTFTGALAGFVFKRGPLGLGYYPDQPLMAAGAKGKAGAKAAAAAGSRGGANGGETPAEKAAAAAAAKAKAASAWGLPTRNKPIIPVRHSDFLSDSDDEGRGGGAAAGGRGGRRTARDSGSDSEPEGEPGAVKVRSGVPAGRSVLQQRKTAIAVGGGSGMEGLGAGDGGASDDDDFAEGGEHEAAKKKYKPMPGRLRKKLAKMKNQGQGQKAAGGRQPGRPQQARKQGATNRQRG